MILPTDTDIHQITCHSLATDFHKHGQHLTHISNFWLFDCLLRATSLALVLVTQSYAQSSKYQSSKTTTKNLKSTSIYQFHLIKHTRASVMHLQPCRLLKVTMYNHESNSNNLHWFAWSNARNKPEAVPVLKSFASASFVWLLPCDLLMFSDLMCLQICDWRRQLSLLFMLLICIYRSTVANMTVDLTRCHSKCEWK